VARSSRGFSRGHNQSLRRKSAWSDGTGGTGLTTFSASSAAFVGAALQPAVEGLTLIRIRGYFRCVLEQVAAADEGYRGAFGIGLASAAAVAAGIASVPTPITEQESENWLYWQAFGVSAVTGTIADGVNAVAAYFEAQIDSKSMRKFPPDLNIYAAMEVVETGTAVMRVNHDSRALSLLP